VELRSSPAAMRLPSILLTLIGFAQASSASLIITPGYGEYLAVGGITRDQFFWGPLPGEILDHAIELKGAQTTPVSGPRTNVAALGLSLLDPPLVPLVVGSAHGCCGLTVRFPERVELENDEIGVTPMEVVDLHLTGSMNVDAGGEVRVWDIDVRLVEPTLFQMHTTGVYNGTAVLFIGGRLPLHYEFIERGGPGRLSLTQNFSFPGVEVSYLTTIPEPSSLGLLLIGGAAAGLLRFYRSKRSYFFNSPTSRTRRPKGPA
jgi:hypothetical protein